MKIALIFPRLSGQVHGMWPPLGIITLGTILRNQGHDVRCMDLSFDRTLERCKKVLVEFYPDVVGVSTLTDFFCNAAELIRFAKERGAVTVMGGPHPTVAPRESFKMLLELDYAVQGEGEITFPELLKAVSAKEGFQDIAGLAYRSNGEVMVNEMRPGSVNLDELPIPDRDLLDVNSKYLAARAINMHVSRGCPYRCRFCQPTLRKMFGPKVKFAAPGKVAEEIKYLHNRYHVTDFFFHDDTFTVSRKWLSGLVEELGRAALIKGFRYVVNSRVDTFDQEIADLLRAMGVYYVLFGIESGSQRILDSLCKGITVEQSRGAYALCREYGFRTHAYVLIGSPEEDRESLRQTEDLVDELRPNTVHISIYTPLIGTDLAEECASRGMININDFSEFDYYLKRHRAAAGPLTLPHITYEELLQSRARMLKRRKSQLLRDNLTELVRDFRRDPHISKFIFRYSFYRKMKHYFG